MMTYEEINDQCYPYDKYISLCLDDLVWNNGGEAQAHGDIY